MIAATRLDERRIRLARRAVEKMVVRRWTTAIITDADIDTAISRVDSRLFGGSR